MKYHSHHETHLLTWAETIILLPSCPGYAPGCNHVPSPHKSPCGFCRRRNCCFPIVLHKCFLFAVLELILGRIWAFITCCQTPSIRYTVRSFPSCEITFYFLGEWVTCLRVCLISEGRMFFFFPLNLKVMSVAWALETEICNFQRTEIGYQSM